MVIMLVSGLAQPVIGWLLQRAAGHPIGPGMSFTAHDFKMALLLFPIFSVIGFIGALFLKEKTR